MSRAKSTSKIEFVCQFTVLKELQSILAFYAYEQVKVSGSSMKTPDLHQAVFDKYHGRGDDIVGLVEKFIRGEEMFAGIYDEAHDVITGRSNMVLKPGLHCQVGKEILLEADPRLKGINVVTMTCSKLTDSKPLSGRQIWEMGKRVEEYGRKMLAIVMQSKFKEGTLPSGCEWEDYLKYCRFKMMHTYFPAATKTNGNTTQSETPEVDEDILIKEWDSHWTFPGYMAWALWGFLPMPGMDSEYRSQCFMTGDDSVSTTNKKCRGRETIRTEMKQVVPKGVHHAAKKADDICVKEQFLYAEHQNAKRFRRDMIDLGQLEMELSLLNRELDQANQLVMEFRALVMTKPDIFERPEQYDDWYPYQQWKSGVDSRNKIMKEIALLRVQTREARKLIALEAKRDAAMETINFVPPQLQVPMRNVIVMEDDVLTLTTATTESAADSE